MKQLLVATTAGIAVLAGSIAFGGTANAVPIPVGSTLNITGNATFTATQVSFNTPAALALGTGAYVPLGTYSGLLSCVTISTPLTFSPFTAGQLFSATNNSITATVSVVSQLVAPSISANVLTIQDNVSLTLSTFDTTPGQLFLTVNQATGAISGSFSATVQSVAVPEPMTLALFGTGLLGLGLTQLKRKSS